MEVRFRTRRLEQCYLEFRLASREFGAEVARRYIQRIQIVKNTRSVDELRRLPGLRFHALSGSREAQYAINLNSYYRLIVTLEGAELQIVRVEEVSKHYGD